MKELFNDYVQSLETYIMFQIKQTTIALTPELTAKGRAPIALDMGAPLKSPPKFVIDKLKEALDEPNMHTYSTPKGEQFFLDAVAKKMKDRFNVEVDPKTEICSLIGSKEGIANIIRELINPKFDECERDIILIPDPGYASYKEMIKVSGGVGYSVCLTPENKYMPNFDDVILQLEKDGYDPKKVKALIINYPNNPLGAVATKEYLESAVAFCKRRGILLISDAAYLDVTFGNTPPQISTLEIPGAKEVTLEFFSLSKPYAMTGWRIGWVCGNAEAVAMFSKLKSTIDSGLFKPMQKAAAAILNSEEGDKYTKELNSEFQANQKILVQGFKDLGWDMDNLNVPEATFYLWLPIPPRYKTSREFTDDVLRTSGVVFVPGDGFGKCGEGYFRISIVVPPEKLDEVISRLKADGFTY